MIVKIETSPVKNKRYRITMDDGRKFDFGWKGGATYLDNKDKNKREAYIARHIANDTEKKLIDNLVPSPALFSAYVLWSYRDPSKITKEDNIKILNRLWSKSIN